MLMKFIHVSLSSFKKYSEIMSFVQSPTPTPTHIPKFMKVEKKCTHLSSVKISSESSISEKT